MLKPQITGPDDNNKPYIENFTHSFQKAICIGHISIAPDATTVKKAWSTAWGTNKKKMSYRKNFWNKKIKKRLDVIPKNIKKKFLKLIKPHLSLNPETQRQELIEKCQCFELGQNRCQTVGDPDGEFTPTEPNEESVYRMVEKWMDSAFEQAEILRVIKYIMLEPLVAQIVAISELSISKKKGEHSKILKRLTAMAKEHYIFG